MRRFVWLVCLGLVWSSGAVATNNIYSETSHTIFGSVVGGVCTWGADFYVPEHRTLLGFGVAPCSPTACCLRPRFGARQEVLISA